MRMSPGKAVGEAPMMLSALPANGAILKVSAAVPPVIVTAFAVVNVAPVRSIVEPTMSAAPESAMSSIAAEPDIPSCAAIVKLSPAERIRLLDSEKMFPPALTIRFWPAVAESIVLRATLEPKTPSLIVSDPAAAMTNDPPEVAEIPATPSTVPTIKSPVFRRLKPPLTPDDATTPVAVSISSLVPTPSNARIERFETVISACSVGVPSMTAPLVMSVSVSMLAGGDRRAEGDVAGVVGAADAQGVGGDEVEFRIG